MGDERRRHIRMPADLTVLCENLASAAALGADSAPSLWSCSLADISLGGIKMITARSLGLGLAVRIVMMTSSVSQPLELEGKVAWEKAVPDAFHVGVEFSNVSREDEKMLRDLFELL
jgi:c-di-GMP-binding flagellar brake protein YcgR